MDKAYVVHPDTVLRLVGPQWIVSNPRLRTHVELDSAAVRALVQVASAADASAAAWCEAFGDSKGRDRTARGLGADGLHGDHSGFSNVAGEWTSMDQLLELVNARGLVVSDLAATSERVRPLTGLLDREGLGTFHQRVGQYLLLERRALEYWREWHDQKFSSDGMSLLDTPYRRIQEPFFDRYFSKKQLSGRRVLDFGCGNAYFSAKFAALGASVVGLDSSEPLLEIASRNHGRVDALTLTLTPSFEHALDLIRQWGPASFDLVYLQDTLLLLLHPEEGEPSPAISDLLVAFRQLLRPGGTLCAMEPNATFWLAARYGDPAHPYAVVTEYRRPVFHVAPTLDRVMAVMAGAGFALADLRHPAPEASEAHAAVSFGGEFPIWDFLVFVPFAQ